MLGEKFDTLCKTTAAISMILFLVAPAFVFRFFDKNFYRCPNLFLYCCLCLYCFFLYFGATTL